VNKRYCCVVLLILLGLPPVQWAWSRDIPHEIRLVKQEQAHLRQIRKSLDAKLGKLGHQMQRLDQELLLARQDFKRANQAWLAAKRKVEALSRQKQTLQETIHDIQQRMQAEASMAWQRDHREPSWLDVLAGGDVTAVPHRQMMMRFVLEGQAKERKAWQTALQDLKRVDAALQVEYKAAAQLKSDKLKMKKQVEQRWQAKHRKMQALKRDATLKKHKEEALRQQEKVLLQMLAGLKYALNHGEQLATQVSIRHRKGHLPWPLKGRLMVHFGDKLASSLQPSKGVEMKPLHHPLSALKVRAMHAGQVRYADWFGGFGLMMVVEYGHGVLAVYAHNDALHKQVGDWVEKGDVLADAGSTGWVEQTRLYFEIRDHGKPVNPEKWCR